MILIAVNTDPARERFPPAQAWGKERFPPAQACRKRDYSARKQRRQKTRLGWKRRTATPLRLHDAIATGRFPEQGLDFANRLTGDFAPPSAFRAADWRTDFVLCAAYTSRFDNRPAGKRAPERIPPPSYFARGAVRYSPVKTGFDSDFAFSARPNAFCPPAIHRARSAPFSFRLTHSRKLLSIYMPPKRVKRIYSSDFLVIL